ncbi:MAG: NAD(P)-dependent oxidoreductase [Actinomycetota bacterium]
MCIGFIGLGRMGLPMCANLAAAGYTVIAGDARAELRDAVLECGAIWDGKLTELAARADILITMLPGPAAVTDVMSGSGVLAALPSTATWIDMTSNSPDAARPLAAAAHARGIGVLDAPVGGGVPAARAGQLQLFVGGSSDLLDQCRPVLEVLAEPQHITHTGANGSGYLTKLLVNLLWFGHAVATAEALLLARRSGIDLDVLHQALAASAGSSAFVVSNLSSLLDGDYLASFELDRCCEELAAVTALARDLNMPSELMQQVEKTYQRALRRYGSVDGELLAIALLEEEAGILLRHLPG